MAERMTVQLSDYKEEVIRIGPPDPEILVRFNRKLEKNKGRVVKKPYPTGNGRYWRATVEIAKPYRLRGEEVFNRLLEILRKDAKFENEELSRLIRQMEYLSPYQTFEKIYVFRTERWYIDCRGGKIRSWQRG